MTVVVVAAKTRRRRSTEATHISAALLGLVIHPPGLSPFHLAIFLLHLAFFIVVTTVESLLKSLHSTSRIPTTRTMPEASTFLASSNLS